MQTGVPDDAGGAAPPWCDQAWPWWPSVYGYVQREYWNVGLLRYWHAGQVGEGRPSVYGSAHGEKHGAI